MTILQKVRGFFSSPRALRRRMLSVKVQRIRTSVFYAPGMRACGKKTVVQKPLFWTPEYVHCGGSVFIWRDARLEAVLPYLNTDSVPALIIGDQTTIEQRCHVTFAGTLKIGSHVTISFDVSIQDTDHEYATLGVSIGRQPLVQRTTEIGDFCFIGAGVRIQAGTILGKHCVVGSNAVVRGNFPDYSVIVGIPGRIIKRYDAESGEWKKTDIRGEFLHE